MAASALKVQPQVAQAQLLWTAQDHNRPTAAMRWMEYSIGISQVRRSERFNSSNRLTRRVNGRDQPSGQLTVMREGGPRGGWARSNRVEGGEYGRSATNCGALDHIAWAAAA